MSFTLEPIGHVQGGRAEPLYDHWGTSRSAIAFDEVRFGPDALAGLAAFSHAEVLFLFDPVAAGAVETGARHPRGRGDWRLARSIGS